MPSTGATGNKNIVASLDNEIDAFFGLDRLGLSHQKKTACVLLCKEPSRRDGAELVRRLLDRIVENRSALTEAGLAARGNELWRWKKNTSLSLANTSLEVRIEKAIVRLLGDTWTNQVPAASGLSEDAEQRRSVDIVHRHDPKEFAFIELKALRPGETSRGDQTPLFAAMEVLKYGLLFLYCKKHRDLLFPGCIEHRPILKANRVNLEVLMTANCYLHSEKRGPFRIGWLSCLIADGLHELNEYQMLMNCESRVHFDFSFRQFPGSFVWSDEDHEALLTSTEGSLCWNMLRDRIVAAVEERELALLL